MPQPPCAGRQGYIQPSDYPFWHLNPTTQDAQQVCFHCPLRRSCAQQELEAAHPDIPDGVLVAGVICRGDTRTLAMLQAVAAPPEPEPLAPVIPITAARRGKRPRDVWPRPCVGCERLMMPSSRLAEGFVRHRARMLCDACHKAERRSLAA